jgi:ribosomal RNA-processing protein 36
MGRRPRPAHRAPPKSLHKDTKKPKRKSYNSKIPVIRHEPSLENEQSEDDNFFVQGSSKDSVNSVSDSEGSITPNGIDDHQDADAPRVVQWVDDDDDDQLEADALDEDSAEHVVNDLVRGPDLISFFDKILPSLTF